VSCDAGAGLDFVERADSAVSFKLLSGYYQQARYFYPTSGGSWYCAGGRPRGWVHVPPSGSFMQCIGHEALYLLPLRNLIQLAADECPLPTIKACGVGNVIFRFL
jgi:hypothetical protein